MGRFVPAPFYVIKGLLFLGPIGRCGNMPRPDSHRSAGPRWLVLASIPPHIAFSLTLMQRSPGTSRCCIYLLLFVAVGLLSIVFFFVLARVASALASPFNDLVSQKTEEIVSGTFHDTPFSIVQLARDSGRSIGHSFKSARNVPVLLIGALLLL